MKTSLGIAAGVLALALTGCGNVVVENGSGGGNGGSGGSGGNGGGTTLTGTETTDKICGGKQGLTCDANEWCDYPDGVACGCCDATGVCTPKPLDCPLDCTGVCGCDGNFYCNECLANLAGVDVDPVVSCAAPTVDYAMVMLPTDAPRFVILKTTDTTCIRLTAVGFSAGDPKFTVDVTAPWTIESIVLTSDPKDCDAGLSWPNMPQGKFVDAASAVGKLVIDVPDIPCGAAADMQIGFPFTGWGPDVDSFQSPYLSSGIQCDL